MIDNLNLHFKIHCAFFFYEIIVFISIGWYIQYLSQPVFQSSGSFPASKSRIPIQPQQEFNPANVPIATEKSTLHIPFLSKHVPTVSQPQRQTRICSFAPHRIPNQHQKRELEKQIKNHKLLRRRRRPHVDALLLRMH